jgi:hypothetical protein
LRIADWGLLIEWFGGSCIADSQSQATGFTIADCGLRIVDCSMAFCHAGISSNEL